MFFLLVMAVGGNMARWHRILLCLLLLLGLQGQLKAETLKIFGDEDYAPVIHLKDGNPIGFIVDILRRAEAETGDQYEIELLPWKRAYELSRMGSGGLLGVSLTSERAEIFDFSMPVFDDDIHVVTLKSSLFTFTQLPDLKGKTLGGVVGASYGEEVDQAIASGLFTVERDIGVTNRMRKLIRRRLDGALVGNGKPGFEAVLNSHPELVAERASLVWSPTPLARDRLYLAFPKSMNKKAALERFNTALIKVSEPK